MRKEQRLRKRTDFDAVYREGRVVSNNLLVLRVRPNGLGISRLGFVTGKVLGGAVVRNRVRRRLREIARAVPIASGLDIVVGARKPAVEAEFDGLKRAFASLAKRAGAAAADPAPDEP